MSSVQTTITQLPQAGPITGTESVPIVQNGQTVQTTTSAIASSPNQQQTFLTLNQQPTLPNSRALSSSTGIGLVDGGPLSTLQITLNGVSGSLETSNDGIIVKSSGLVIGRSITSSGNGISVSNANGTAGNPVLSLTGPVGDINGLAGTGILGIVNGTSITSMTLLGTTDQIDVANGQGPGNPTFSIASNPVMPGTGAMTLPVGTSLQRPAGSGGQIRYNSQTGEYEVYQNGWVDISTSSGFLDVYKNGVLVATQDGLNFIESSNISFTVTDDAINNRVDVTPNLTITGAVAGSYGSQSNTLTATVDIYGRLSALAQTAIGNLPNSALQNSSVTFNGVSVALGASGTITAAVPNALTAGTGLQFNSGTTFDGSVAKTISIDSSVVTLTGSQVLTNKTINGPDNTLTNIANSSLSNSSVTFNGVSVALGASGTITAATPNSVTFNNSGSGDASGASFDGSAAKTVSYNTLGAPKADGTGASGTWNIDISGNAATATSSTTATNLAGGSAGSIPYQTGSGTTTFLSQSSGVLVGGVTPSYSTAPSLAGTNFSSIPNGALQNSSITIGSTGISLGATASTLAGLTSVTVTQPPASALQLATKQYVDDQVASGIDIHTPVRVEAPTALNATYTPGGTAVTVTDITGSKTLTFSSSPGLAQNDQIVFSSTANGITAGTAYYVYSAPAGNQVTLSLTYNGPEITTLTNGTGLTIAGLVNAGVGATLTNAGTNAAIQIDGVNLSSTNRVLVYNQVNAYENGVYTVTTVGTPDPGGTPWVLTRSTDTDTYKPDSTSGLGQGDYFFVQEGSTGAGESYVLTTSNPLIIGTTNLTFTQFSASQVYSAGTGLTLSGTQFSLTVPVITTNGGTGLTSYTTGDIVYYSTGTALSKLAIGTSTYLMTSSGTAPQWSAPSGITVGTASNVAGGSTGAIVYNTSSGTTTFLALGAQDYVLTAGATAPQYVAQSTLSVGSATTATNANNIATTAVSTNASFYPVFVSATTGNLAPNVDSDMTYNPSTNTLTATTFSGALSGNATTATTATNATNVAVTADSTNASRYLGFYSATTGNLGTLVDADLTYNPSTNTLTAGTMVATTGIFGGTF